MSQLLGFILPFGNSLTLLFICLPEGILVHSPHHGVPDRVLVYT